MTNSDTTNLGARRMIGRILIVLSLGASCYGQDVSNSLPSAAGRTLGLGGRMSLSQRQFDDPRIWLDAHVVLQPLPRLFFEGSWGRASEARRGEGPDTTYSETRWDITMGVVLLPGTATGYVPVMWRSVTQRNSAYPDASWKEMGTGIGAIVPLHQWLSLQTETMWVWPLRPHADMELGPGRESEGSHFELSLSFLAYIK